MSAYARGEYDRALSSFNAILPLNLGESVSDSRSVPWASDERALTNAFYYRGLIYQEKQEWDKAIADFTTVIRREPESALALFERGESYGSKREPEKALRDFDAVIRLKPGDAHAHMRRSETLQVMKRWHAALDAAASRSN